jgi:hypothetical protein
MKFQFLRFLVVFNLIVAFTSCTENQNSPTEKVKSTSINDDTPVVIPKDSLSASDEPQFLGFANYTKLAAFSGDLNSDGTPDKLIVFETTCDAVPSDDAVKCRRLAIYLSENGKLKLYASNDDLIECSDCGGAGVGDPFQDIVIKGSTFSVESLYGACDKTAISTSFKFDKTSNEFYLNRIETLDWSCHFDEETQEVKTTEKVETQKEFGKIKFVDYP